MRRWEWKKSPVKAMVKSLKGRIVEGLVIALDRDDGTVLGSQLEEVVE
jgi:hypothetical protein